MKGDQLEGDIWWGVSIYETTFGGINIRAVTAVDVSSTLRLPATSLSDWQPA